MNDIHDTLKFSIGVAAGVALLVGFGLVIDKAVSRGYELKMECLRSGGELISDQCVRARWRVAPGFSPLVTK